jgi:hypothetical protein
MKIFSIISSLFTVHALFASSRPKPGCVGIYYKNGKRIDPIQQSGGWNFRFMPTTKFYNDISIQLQVDNIKNVECGSKDGLTLKFPEIKVYNILNNDDTCIKKVIDGFHIPGERDYDQILIYSIIESEVLQFCKDYTFDEIYIKKFNTLDELLMEKLTQNLIEHGVQDCLKIKDVRLTRPSISRELKERFEEIEMEKKKKILKEQEKITQELENEIAQQKAVAIKNKEKAEQKVELEKLKEKAESDNTIQEINNEIQYKKQKSIADSIKYAETSKSDSEKYKKEKEIEVMNSEIESLGDVKYYLEKQRIHAHRDAKNLRTHWFAGDIEKMPKILMPGMTGSPLDETTNIGDIKSNIPTDGKCHT